MSEASKIARSQIQAIEEVLRRWDPIGVIADLVADGLLPNEYDDYAPHIVGMLSRGASAEELARHLSYCRTGAMGLRANVAEDRKYAQEIYERWRVQA
jgi:hypothetical protein